MNGANVGTSCARPLMSRGMLVGVSAVLPALALALVLVLALGSGSAHAANRQARVDLRVVDPSGTQLVDAVVYTSSTRVRTSRRALCFGEGTGGSGGFSRTAVRGPNAMGAIADAAAELSVLRPLRVSDAFVPELGQSLCAIGKLRSFGSFYWAIWVDQSFVESSADNAQVDTGQDLVFQLTDEYPSTSLPGPSEIIGRTPVVGAPGRFAIFDTDGSDRILGRDGRRDSITCSSGEDIVYADQADRIHGECEEVIRG